MAILMFVPLSPVYVSDWNITPICLPPVPFVSELGASTLQFGIVFPEGKTEPQATEASLAVLRRQELLAN